ncbi:MAG: LysR family transcriptional regulator [Pseudomonadota bacterium]
MNIAALQTFLAVVQTGNLNKAADQLNVTQSTVTTRLDVLEDTLGQKLLIRSRRGAALTRAGFAFQRHAEVMVQEWDQARKAVGLPKGFSGLFSFACEPDLWDGAGEVWLERVRRAQPELALEAWEAGPGAIRRWLASGLVDAALVQEPLNGPGYASRPAGMDRLVQVATVEREAQTWDPAYIFVDLGPEFRRQHALAWPGEETARMTFSSSRWALDHLLKQGGSAYLPWRVTKGPVAEGRLFPVEGAAEFGRSLYFVCRDASLSANDWLAQATSETGLADALR